MATEGLGQTLGPAVVLLAAGVVAVPLFRKLGLGSVLDISLPVLWWGLRFSGSSQIPLRSCIFPSLAW